MAWENNLHQIYGKLKVETGIEFNHQLLQLTASFSASEKIAYAEKYISMWLPPNCKMSS